MKKFFLSLAAIAGIVVGALLIWKVPLDISVDFPVLLW